MNLASYTANSSMRKSFYSSTANNFTATITDNASQSEITLTMTASETASLKPGRYVYDLLITDDAGTKSRIVEGIVSVTP